MGNIKVNDDGTISPIDPTKPSSYSTLPRPSNTELREAIKENIEQHLIAYGCKVCDGGGTDDNNEVCTHCKGLGIVDFETKYIVDKLEALLQAREQKLLNELLGHAKGNAVGYPCVPVSVIERYREGL